MRSRFIVFLAAAAAPAQVAFERLPQLPALRGIAVDLDPVRNRVVTYGSDDAGTYEWDGGRWWRMAVGGAPGPRLHHGLAFDPVSRRMLLFGGLSWTSGAMNDTWAWDGRTWTRLPSANAPSPRYYVRMATDYARARIVLYGGFDRGNVFADTWEWNGQDWILRSATGPGPRMQHALAYDPLRRVTVLFGGKATDLGPRLADTWEWDGNAWQLRSPAATPPARAGAALAFDFPARALVLFGGRGAGFDEFLHDTWEYDGSTWRQRQSAVAPLGREDAAAAPDPATLRPLLAGGGRSTYASSDVFRWGNAGWAPAPTCPPPNRVRGAFVFDGTRMILFGGRFLQFGEILDDMWAFDGSTCLDLTPRPPALYPIDRHTRVTAVYQTHRGRVLAVVPEQYASRTWEWDGTRWSDRTPAVAPVGFDYPLAYDARRQRVVCVASIVGLSATWEWDGSAWSWRGSAPQGTFGQALAYDPNLDRVVLFGGGDVDGTVYGGTFAWDGMIWQRLQAGTVPPRKGAALVHDPARGRLVLFGGEHYFPFADAYELIGGTWQQRSGGGPWTAVPETPAAWDPRTSAILVLGTEVDPCSPWRYGPVAPAGFATFGVGCRSGGLALAADGLPWSGDPWRLVLGVLQSSAPAVIALGTSTTRYLGIPLPFDLGPIGMAGCTLLTSPDLAIPVANAGGMALLTLQVPVLPRARFYAQGFAAHAAANPLGIVTSNGGAGIIGNR